MQIRDKTKIGPHWFKTVYKSDDKDGFEHSGRKFGWKCELWINSDAQRSKQETTYIHEWIHEIDYQHGLNLKENQVDTLAICLYQILIENKLVRD